MINKSFYFRFLENELVFVSFGNLDLLMKNAIHNFQSQITSFLMFIFNIKVYENPKTEKSHFQLSNFDEKSWAIFFHSPNIFHPTGHMLHSFAQASAHWYLRMVNKCTCVIDMHRKTTR